MKDNRTQHLQLPLPHADNLLEDDVGRIVEALQGVDAYAHATNLALDGKADTHVVTTSLASKADEAAVALALGMKADTLVMENALAQKADSTAMNAALAQKAASSHTHPVAQVTGLGTAATRNITISTAGPSGGNDGDIWIQYV